MDSFSPGVYWAIAVAVAILYCAFAVLIGKCCGLNDSDPEDR